MITKNAQWLLLYSNFLFLHMLCPAFILGFLYFKDFINSGIGL